MHVTCVKLSYRGATTLIKLLKRTGESVLYGTILSGLTLSQTAYATDDTVDFAGFASFAYSKVISGDKDGNHYNGTTSDGSERDFNTFGLRMNADLKENLTFTSQVIAKGEDDYEPEVDWMFVTLQLRPDLSISLGKTRLPLFMYSDYLDVGYAYQWVHAPYSVYGIPSFSNIDGIQLNYNFYLGDDWSSDLTIWSGTVDDPLPELGGNNLLLDDAIGAAWSIERDWLTLRAVYFEGDATADITGSLSPETRPIFNAVYNGVEALQTAGVIDHRVIDAIDVKRDPSQYLGLGVFMDFETVFVSAEATQILVDHTIAIGELNSAYVMAGVRLPDDWTLSLTFSRDVDLERDKAVREFNKQTATIQQTPAHPAFTDVMTVKAGLEGISKGAQTFDRKAWALTARWDFSNSAAFKTEYSYARREVGGSQELEEPHALSIGLDLVF